MYQGKPHIRRTIQQKCKGDNNSQESSPKEILQRGKWEASLTSIACERSGRAQLPRIRRFCTQGAREQSILMLISISGLWCWPGGKEEGEQGSRVSASAVLLMATPSRHQRNLSGGRYQLLGYPRLFTSFIAGQIFIISFLLLILGI